MLQKLVGWAALARNTEPLPIYWSLWWAIKAKVHRTEGSETEVIAKVVRSKNLGELVPFSDHIRADDITQLNPPAWVDMVHKKGLPRCYAEALWRSAVAKAKLSGNTFLSFLEELSQRLGDLKQPKQD